MIATIEKRLINKIVLQENEIYVPTNEEYEEILNSFKWLKSTAFDINGELSAIKLSVSVRTTHSNLVYVKPHSDRKFYMHTDVLDVNQERLGLFAVTLNIRDILNETFKGSSRELAEDSHLSSIGLYRNKDSNFLYIIFHIIIKDSSAKYGVTTSHISELGGFEEIQKLNSFTLVGELDKLLLPTFKLVGNKL